MTQDKRDALTALEAAQNAYNAAASQAQLSNQARDGHPWSVDLVVYLSSSVLMFTFASLLLASLLLWRSNARATHILRVFGVIIIIAMSAVLLVVGYSNAQLTPIVGLFGAIAGYLLGKEPQPVALQAEAKDGP